VGLAEALRALRGTPERLESMGIRARLLLMQRFRVQHAEAQWMGFLSPMAPGVGAAVAGQSGS
jgi:hypothetical protein